MSKLKMEFLHEWICMCKNLVCAIKRFFKNKRLCPEISVVMVGKLPDLLNLDKLKDKLKPE